MDVLKMANNGLNNDEFNAIKSLITENKIRILFYDYNIVKGNDFYTAL